MHIKRSITLADVAAAANVSKMTASRALRGAADVSPASRDAVLRAARDLGYVGNHVAGAMSSQSSDLIGVVVPSLANIVFAEVLSGIADTLKGTRKQAVFGVTDYDTETECDVIRSMLSWKPAGLIVTGLDQSADARALLEAADLPVVQIMDLDGDPIDACVGFSQVEAGAAMARALLSEGRTRIGYLGCGLDRDTRAAKRLHGFRKALSEAGVEILAEGLKTDASTMSAGRSMTAELLRERPDLDAIYFSNDDLAAGGLFHCLAYGVSVPSKLRLAGFNGLDFVESLPAPLATTRTPRREIGATAAEIILQGSPSKGEARRKSFVPELLFPV